MSTSRPLPRYLVEGLVIVASILFAFAIDAWWDGRQEAERRAAVMASLRSDMALARADLDRETLVGRDLSLDIVDELRSDGAGPDAGWFAEVNRGAVGGESAVGWNPRPPGAAGLLHTVKYRSLVSTLWVFRSNQRAVLEELDATMAEVEARIALSGDVHR